MEISHTKNPPELHPGPQRRLRLPAYPRSGQVLLLQFALCMVLAAIAGFLYQLFARMFGWDIGLLTGEFDANAETSERWQMRVILAISHLFTFILAGAGAVGIFYRAYRVSTAEPDEYSTQTFDWKDYLGLRRRPATFTILWACALMLAAFPFVLWLFQVNKALPIPEALRLMENDTNEAMKGLLRMHSPGEFIANLVLIALMPAIGEELVFRGVVQQQLMRHIANPWIGIAVTAALFSFIHFQFEGFLPRMLLGVVLGWLYWRSHNFWVPVAAHFVNNAVQIVVQYLFQHRISTIDLEKESDIPLYLAAISGALVFVMAERYAATLRT
jgi:uncharacterized protein